VNIDISGNRPKKLTVEMLSQADKAITMGCGTENACPASFVETEDWELEDPKSQSIEKIREIRNQIKTRVEKLIKEMQI
jgi:arsenate reductase